MSFLRSKSYWKTVLACAIASSCGLALLYFMVNASLTDFFLDDVRENLLIKARLVSDRIESRGGMHQKGFDADELADRLGEESGARVTMIDFRGTVIGDSEVPADGLSSLSNHIERPEVRQAMTSGYGVATRYSETTHATMLYLALKASDGIVRLAMPVRRIDSFLHGLRISTGLSALLSLAVTIVAGIAVFGYFIKPLVEASRIAGIAARGDLRARLPLRMTLRTDEFGTLAKSINSMAENLSRQIEATGKDNARLTAILHAMEEGVMVTDDLNVVRTVNPALLSLFNLTGKCVGTHALELFRNTDIAETLDRVLADNSSHEREIAYRLGNEERIFMMHAAPLDSSAPLSGCVAVFYNLTALKKLDGIRREFLDNASHELKSPLTAIMGYAETLETQGLDNKKEAAVFFRKIKDNAVRLKDVCDTLLNISSIEAGRLSLDMASLDIGSILQTVVDDFKLPLKERNLSIRTVIPESGKALANSTALMRIIGNLLENAIAYSHEGGTISIEAHLERRMYKITVSDEGIGIPQADLPRIFERFYRVDKSRARSSGGAGLGLAIVKHLVKLHGGEVGVESAVGKGSSFWFTIPAA